MFKKNHWSGSQNARLHNFWTNWPRQLLFFYWGIQYSYFWQSIVSHHTSILKFKKNLYRESWDIRFCNFGANWDQIAKFSLLVQSIKRSPAPTKYLLILSPTTRRNLPFLCRLALTILIPLHLILISMFYLSKNHHFQLFCCCHCCCTTFNFINFVHSDHVNFNFNQCSMFTKCCF